MSFELALVLFLPCLAGVITGSVWLSRGLREFGDRLQLLPGLLGLITALGADSPEIASAVTALIAGEHEVGVGVVLGSNLFNLAALIGLSPLLAHQVVSVKRGGVVFNGVVSLLITAIATLLILRIISPPVCIIFLVLVFGGYLLMLWLHSPEVRRLPLPGWLSSPLARMVADVHEHSRTTGHDEVEEKRGRGAQQGAWILGLLITGSLVLIIAASMGLVHSVLRVAAVWGISSSLVGALVLAMLTGIPNTYTSARLARRGKGAAVVSETINSNTINIVVGIGLPALVFGMSAAKNVAIIELCWLLALTAVAIVLAAIAKGVTRGAGVTIIALYLGFVATRVLLS